VSNCHLDWGEFTAASQCKSFLRLSSTAEFNSSARFLQTKRSTARLAKVRAETYWQNAEVSSLSERSLFRGEENVDGKGLARSLSQVRQVQQDANSWKSLGARGSTILWQAVLCSDVRTRRLRPRRNRKSYVPKLVNMARVENWTKNLDDFQRACSV